MKILDREIGTDKPTYFIADIAANHDGDLNRALRLIELAAEAGADCVKFQHHKSETVASDKGFKDLGGQFSHQSKWKKSVYETYQDAELPIDWTPYLAQKANECGVHFMTSPYDLDMVDIVNQYVPAYKIGSGDLNYHAMIQKIASKGKPIILSTGASTFEEINSAVWLLIIECGVDPDDIAVLQCNTNYTAVDANFDHIHLNVLRELERIVKVVGLSDHTHGHVTVLGAVALGARIIEKHFTDDNDREGPDHPFSMTPETWRVMVDDVRKLERALGSHNKFVAENELETVVLQRRSARLIRDAKEGEVITLSDIEFQRPCPADAMNINDVYDLLTSGQKQLVLKRNLAKDDYIRMSDV